MKKLSNDQITWLTRRAFNQRKRVFRKRKCGRPKAKKIKQYHATPVQIWQGGQPEWAICTRQPSSPPADLCFSDNAEKTSAFFSEMRRRFFHRSNKNKVTFLTRKNERAIPRIPSYFDFSKLKKISTSAAVVMAADYERVASIADDVPPTVDLNNWTDEVFTTLYQLGFFSILGHTPGISRQLVEDGPTLTMKIVSAKKADDLQKIDENLQLLGKFLSEESGVHIDEIDPIIVKVLTTISEAITNVTQHAYPENHDFTYQHINRFWVAATACRLNRSLTVVIYDQGATIPITYPKLDRTGKVVSFLKRAIKTEDEFDYRNDGTYIRAAMRYGGSRTGQPYRGKGFPQMFELLQSLGPGTLSIRSRNGWCTRNHRGKVRSGFIEKPLGGTLVEWTVDLKAIQGTEGK